MGRLGCRWKDDIIKMGLGELECELVDRIQFGQDLDQGGGVVNTVMTFFVFSKRGRYFD